MLSYLLLSVNKSKTQIKLSDWVTHQLYLHNGCERPSLQHQSNAVAPLGAPSTVWTQPVHIECRTGPLVYLFFILEKT